MENYFSPYLCGFRKGYSTQDCLLSMIEKWRKSLDKREKSAAILTDLSKASDSLNHSLLIAKLEAMVLMITLLFYYMIIYLIGNNELKLTINLVLGVP